MSKRGLTILPDEMVNWRDHGKVVSVMPSDDSEIQELISEMPNGSLIVATNEEESNDSTVMKHGVNVPILIKENLYFYVDANNGDNANDGSINFPWKTINYALYSIDKYSISNNSNIQIIISNGTYNENISISLQTYNGVIHLIGNDVNDTIINGNITLHKNATVVIYNLTIQNSNNHCVIVGDAYLEIRSNINIIHNGNNSVMAAISASNYANIVITNSNLNINLSSSYAALSSWRHSSIYFADSTIIINGSVTEATIVCSSQSSIMVNPNTVTINGNVIGRKYLVSVQSVIESGGLVFPGTEDGYTYSASYGLYI